MKIIAAIGLCIGVFLGEWTLGVDADYLVAAERCFYGVSGVIAVAVMELVNKK